MLTEASTLKVDLELVKKYSIAGPRYTSYPPATRFDEQFDPGALQRAIDENNRTERPLSLYVHLPFCQSLCWYCGCTTIITTQQSQSAAYLKYVEKELARAARSLNPKRQVEQLHYGGGTPTFLLPDELKRLGDMFRSRFEFANGFEGAVEIDPRRLNREQVVALRATGFNRASIGVQDHNFTVQRAVHRVQPYATTRLAVDWLRNAGFNSVNIDLIYGLPFQTPASFEKTIDDVLRLEPDRLAVFSYAHVPWIKPAQRIFTEEHLPSPETKLELLKLSVEKLTDAGYVFIGMDHFAKADDELAIAQRNKSLQRNFQGYSTRGDADIYSFGLSSISQIPDAYWQNAKELPDYYGALEAGRLPIAKGYLVSEDDKIRRQTIMRLMCDLSLNFTGMSDTLGIDFEDYFAPELQSLDEFEVDGLIERTENGFNVTEMGRLLIRNLAMRFDTYLPAQKKEQCYSKTI